jgi:predicted PurR-regulated permease PerM
MEKNNHSRQMRLEITWMTIFKVLVGVLIAFIAVKLWPMLELLIVALLVSVVLYRIVSWLCDRNWPRWAGLLAATLAFLLVIGGFCGLIVPVVISQADAVARDLPKLKEQVRSGLPQSGPVGSLVQSALNSGTGADSQRILQKGLNAAKATVEGLINGVVAFALVIYFMIDGPKALKWWLAFFPREKRPRVKKGLEEIANRIVSYVVGQLIVSALFATYAFVVLTILRVPMALLLGVLAGMVDILPIIGILVAVVPAALIALTVSPTTALVVLCCYLAYHGIEDYFIIPKVYGNKLHISTLAVLLAMLTGGILAGIIGAIAALPLVAAYASLERLWLAPKLEPEVLKDHEDLRAA